MLELNDGRKELYQWDTGRTATVEVECDRVHFSNLEWGIAFVVDVSGGSVGIPNELLTSGETLHFWAWVGSPENGYTKQSGSIEVKRKPKPSDYVFAPTHQITLQGIQQQIGNISELRTDAKVDIVSAINEVLSKVGTGGGGGGVGVSKIEQTTTSTESGGINVITITLTNGQKTTFQVRNGQKGEKGERGDTGTPGADGKDGTNGKDGTDGYTPVKGIDYYTEADKAEMVSAVLAALPDGDEVSY